MNISFGRVHFPSDGPDYQLVFEGHDEVIAVIEYEEGYGVWLERERMKDAAMSFQQGELFQTP